MRVQCGLADARLADHRDQRPLTGEGAVEGALELAQLGLAPDEDAPIEGSGTGAHAPPAHRSVVQAGSSVNTKICALQCVGHYMSDMIE